MKIRRTFLITIIFLLSFPLQAQDVAGDLLGRINNLRTQQGLSPYSMHPSLTVAAQNHANWMVNTGQVTHIQENGSRPSDRAASAGYNSAWVSENIYMGGLAGVDSAWNFWVNSSVHYRGLTSGNFQHIGIATAQGATGQAFVLVFGVPSGAVAPSNNSGANGNNSSGNAPSQPAYVVGYDEVGNIMHEIQAGHTLGDVLLFYGYTWDDLPALMEVNELTDEDIRSLDIGAIILVPPKSGTYTPTPAAEMTPELTEPAESTEEIIEATSLPDILPTPIEASPMPDNPQPTLLIPTTVPVAADNPQPTLLIPTLEATTASGLIMPATFVFSGATSTQPPPTPTMMPTITPIEAVVVNTVPVGTPLLEATVAPEISSKARQKNRGIPFWIYGVVTVQVGVFGYAGYELVRRMKR